MICDRRSRRAPRVLDRGRDQRFDLSGRAFDFSVVSHRSSMIDFSSRFLRWLATHSARHDRVDLGELGRRQAPACRFGVGLHLLGRGRAGDHRGDRAMRQEPGEGELEQRMVARLGEGEERLDRIQVLGREQVAEAFAGLDPGALRAASVRAGTCRSKGRSRAGSRAGKRDPGARIRAGPRPPGRA